MYDALRGRYTFPCPTSGAGHVSLSNFRVLDRLPGARRPAVFHVRFECSCGQHHEALVPHDDLDWAPLGFQEGSFLNLMTDRLQPVAEELVDISARRIQAGEWPWSFFCYPEAQPRPVYPSSFVMLAPGEGAVGVAVRCPTCAAVSVNLVSHQHVDLPFHNDPSIGVVDHDFTHGELTTIDDFREELGSVSFHERRLDL